MKDSFGALALARELENERARKRLFNGRYSAVGGSDRKIAFPADEARGTNNTLPIFSADDPRRGKRSAYVR